MPCQQSSPWDEQDELVWPDLDVDPDRLMEEKTNRKANAPAGNLATPLPRSALGAMALPSLGADGPLDDRGRGELLAVGRQLVDPTHNLHALDDSAKCSKSLAVRVTSAAEVQFGLVADAKEKRVTRGVRSVAEHRDRAIHVPQSRVASTFQWDWREEVFLASRGPRRLEYFDLHLVGGLVRERERAVKCAVCVQAFQGVAKEIPGGDRGSFRLQFDFDIA
jgi:hypothetical protein